MPILNLVHLCDEKRGRACNLHIKRPSIVRLERGKGHCVNIDDRSLETLHEPSRTFGVPRELRSSAPFPGTQGSRHEQIDGYFGPRIPLRGSMCDPDSNAVFRLGQEAATYQALLNWRRLGKDLWIDGEVSVGGVGSDTQVRFTDTQIDGLSTHEDDGIRVGPESVKRVEQHSTREHVELIHARPPRF